jgi:predicted DNA-binding transcriptional regulator AlpA
LLTCIILVDNENEKNKEFLAITELARILGISMTAVFRNIKNV